MKDLVEVLWRSLTQYIPVLVAMSSAPKTTIVALVTPEENRLGKALAFVGLTVTLGFLLQAPLAADAARFTSAAGSMVAFKILAILLGAAIIMAAFRLVGGAAGFEVNLSAYLYLIGPLYLAGIVLLIMTGGALTTYDRAAAATWYASGVLPDAVIDELIRERPALAAAILLFILAQILILFVWPLICWGAFRTLNRVSRLRSGLAYLIALTGFVFVLSPMFMLVMRGLNDGAVSPIK